MKAQIIQIGNSQGIRIPKVVLEESKIAGEVELEVCAEGILIRNVQKPRGNWEEIFRSMAEMDDDHSMDEVVSASFDLKEWQW